MSKELHTRLCELKDVLSEEELLEVVGGEEEEQQADFNVCGSKCGSVCDSKCW